MILSSSEIARHLDGSGIEEEDRFLLAPVPKIDEIKTKGSASIDLRLGSWFVSAKLSRHPLLDVYAKEVEQPPEQNITAKHYVPLGKKFILHPNCFVLAATLEWLRMPRHLCGQVTGKSSWGRRGLVIETASGVHPGFAGCLTLELANVGEIPIALMPGTHICQIFLFEVSKPGKSVDQSALRAHRQPVLGSINVDSFVKKLTAQ